MLRIAVLNMGQSPAVKFYRSIGVFNELEAQMRGQVRFEYFNGANLNPKTMWEDLYPYPVLFISSALNQHLLPILLQAKAQGIMTWIDVDDDLFNVPRGNPALSYYRKPDAQKVVVQCLKAATVVSVATPALKELYSNYNANVHLVRNAYNAARLPLNNPKANNQKPTRIAWRGSHSHQEDLDQIRDVLNAIIESPDLSMTFYGWRPYFVDEQLCVDWRGGWLGVFEYLHRMATDQPDYLLVPLMDLPFNHAKSNIAWIEATTLGAVTIAPSYLEEFNQPGVLRYKDKEDLKQIVDSIRSERIDRNKLLEYSRTAMLSGFRLEQMNERRADLIAGLFGQKANRVVSTKKKSKNRRSHAKVRPIQ